MDDLPDNFIIDKKDFEQGREILTHQDLRPGDIVALPKKRFGQYLGPSRKSYRVQVFDGWQFEDSESIFRKVYSLNEGDDLRVYLYLAKRDARVTFVAENEMLMSIPRANNVINFTSNQDCLYRLLRPEEALQIEEMHGIFAKDYLEYMSPQSHVRKTQKRSITFSTSHSKVCPLGLSQWFPRDDDDIITIAEIDPSGIIGWARDATLLIDRRTAPQPFNFAKSLEETLIYGCVPKTHIKLYEFPNGFLREELPYADSIKDWGYSKWLSRLKASDWNQIEDIYNSEWR